MQDKFAFKNFSSRFRTDYLPMQMTTLLEVVRKLAHRPAVAASLNRDLARIQEWCNHWCMILNPNNTWSLVVSRSRTVSPPRGDLVLSGVSIRARPNIDILGVKFDRKFTFEDHVRGIVSRVPQRIYIFWLVKRIFVDTLMLLRCYFAFVLPILEYCSAVCGQLLNVTFSFLNARCILWPALSRSEFLLAVSSTSCG